jgi:hypothetical protein
MGWAHVARNVSQTHAKRVEVRVSAATLRLEPLLKAADPGVLLRRTPLSPLEVLVFARKRCLSCGEPLLENGALDAPPRGCKGEARAAHGHRATVLHADFERLLGKRL